MKGKKMMKRLVCYVLVAMLSLSCATTAFATSGIIPNAEQELSAVLKFSSDGEDLSFFDGNKIMGLSNTAGGEILATTTTKLSSGAYYAQSWSKAFETTDKVAGLSFKIKADIDNGSDKMYLYTGSGSEYTGNQAALFSMDAKGNIGLTEKNGAVQWLDNLGSSTMKTTYEKDVWYTVALAIDTENGKVSGYIDGVKMGTADIANPASVQGDGLRFMVHTEGAETAKFYLDDIKYVTDCSNLIAEGKKSVIETAGALEINFTALVLNKQLVSGVKVYESASGSAVEADAEFDGEMLIVNLTGATIEGMEYRVELPDFTDAFGNKLYNNSVYVNTALPAENMRKIAIVSDDFSEYSSTGQYAMPSGWTKSYQWTAFKNVWIQSQDDAENGSAVLIKKDAVNTTGSGNDYSTYSTGAMNLELPSKITSGTVSVSYDFKPIKYRRGGNASKGNANLWETNFAFGVYADVPASGFSSTQFDQSNMKTLQAVKKTQMGFALGTIHATNYDKNENMGSAWKEYEQLDKDGSVWDLNEDVEIANPKWYSVEVILDFDAKTVAYYVDGEKVCDSETLMDTIGIADGISAIGFGVGTEPLMSEQLIDNVEVAYLLPELGEETEIAEDDFSDYSGTEQYVMPSGWTKSNQWASFKNIWIQSQNDTENGSAVLIKKDAVNTTGSGNDYSTYSTGAMNLELPSKLSTGTVSVSYDFKPIKYRRGGNASDNNSNLWETHFSFGVYADAPANGFASTNFDASGIKVLQAVKKTQMGFALGTIAPSNYDKNENMSSIWKMYEELDTDGNPWEIKEEVTIENPKWYSIEIVFDFDTETVTYYVDGIKVCDSATLMDTLGIADGISAIGFGISAESLGSEQLIDNVKVTQRTSKANGGVSTVRFADCMGNIYGANAILTTLTNKLAVSFTKTPDVDSVNEDTVMLKKNGEYVDYLGSLDENGVYVMTLMDLLDKDSEYTLIVDGITIGGVEIPTYVMTVTTEENGRFIVEPIKIYVNGVEMKSGAINNGDKIKAKVDIIDTTGEENSYTFTTALYEGNMLSSVDFVDFDMGENAKRRSVECEFTADETDALNLTKVRAFLWSGFDTLIPFVDAGQFDVVR